MKGLKKKKKRYKCGSGIIHSFYIKINILNFETKSCLFKLFEMLWTTSKMVLKF